MKRGLFLAVPFSLLLVLIHSFYWYLHDISREALLYVGIMFLSAGRVSSEITFIIKVINIIRIIIHNIMFFIKYIEQKKEII